MKLVANLGENIIFTLGLIGGIGADTIESRQEVARPCEYLSPIARTGGPAHERSLGLPWGGGLLAQREKTEVLMKEVSSTPAARPSSATERSRRHRQRRRRGTRCITVDVNESELSALAARDYLPEEALGDAMAIKAAIECVISDLAFELEQER